MCFFLILGLPLPFWKKMMEILLSTGSSYSSGDQRRTGQGQAGDDNVVLLPEVLLTDG